MTDTPTLGELLELNEDLQKSRAVRLLAAKNLAPYITLMERHLDHSAKVAEPELVLRLELDLTTVGLADQTGLGLIKSWASDGWLNRVSDGTGPAAQNVCSLNRGRPQRPGVCAETSSRGHGGHRRVHRGHRGGAETCRCATG